MNFKVEKDGDTAVILVNGEVDMHESPKLRQAFMDEIAKRPKALLVDFAEVTFIDSSGVATMVELMKGCRGINAGLALCGMNKKILDVFELARLDKIFKIVNTRADGLQTLKGA